MDKYFVLIRISKHYKYLYQKYCHIFHQKQRVFLKKENKNIGIFKNKINKIPMYMNNINYTDSWYIKYSR